MDFIHDNLFKTLRRDHFGSGEQIAPMTAYKQSKLDGMLHNIDTVPDGEVALSNRWLNQRLTDIQEQERHSIDCSMPTLQLLRMIVANVNVMLAVGMPLKGIIAVGNYMRKEGNKVDFMKINKWLERLHIRRMAHLQAAVLVEYLGFEPDEFPMFNLMRHRRSTRRLVMGALHRGANEQADRIVFNQTQAGLVSANSKMLMQTLRRITPFITVAPIEATSCFTSKLLKGIAEMEE